MIRLDAIPITGLPQGTKADQTSGSYPTRINCILHSGHLPEHQRLEVQVNGTHQEGVQEENQAVFSWQFLKASDEVRITLLKHGAAVKYWQGCWNERDAILHTGTLPVHVSFNGKTQPMMEAASPETVQANGHENTSELFLRNGATARDARSKGECDTGNENMQLIQHLLIDADVDVPLTQQEELLLTETATNGENGEGEAQEMREREEQDEAWEPEDKGIEDEAFEDEEDEGIGDEVFENEEDAAFEVEEDEGVHSSPLAPEEAPATEMEDVPASTHVATFHASPILRERTFQALKDLMAKMPPKTIIVDLRQQDHHQRKKYQSQSELSKDMLRATFGAKYWDRGWAIKTTLKMVPTTERGTTPRWQTVIINANLPDGIPTLVQYYQQGYSLVVIDSRADYMESARRAVIEALRQRLPTLVVGTLR